MGEWAGGVFNDNNEGLAFVFVRSANVWSQQQVLFAADFGPQQNFGTSVALEGDTAVVGARHDDTDVGINVGAAYLFMRAGNNWTQQQKLTAADGAPGDQLGISVGLSGDTAVARAYWHNPDGVSNAGAAYVFAPDTTPPTCFVSAIIGGPPKQQHVTVQDETGLKEIKNIVITNGVVNTNPSPGPVGTKDPVIVMAVKIDQNKPTTWSFDAVDMAGNVKDCA